MDLWKPAGKVTGKLAMQSPSPRCSPAPAPTVISTSYVYGHRSWPELKPRVDRLTDRTTQASQEWRNSCLFQRLHCVIPWNHAALIGVGEEGGGRSGAGLCWREPSSAHLTLSGIRRRKGGTCEWVSGPNTMFSEIKAWGGQSRVITALTRSSLPWSSALPCQLPKGWDFFFFKENKPKKPQCELSTPFEGWRTLYLPRQGTHFVHEIAHLGRKLGFRPAVELGSVIQIFWQCQSPYGKRQK